MKLSVIIPFFDETIFIRQTVASSLALEDALHEIIIVDDGPLGLTTDSFAGMLGCEKIRVLTNEVNMGPPGSRNAGLREATGDLLMYLDADDILIRDSMLEAIEFAAETRADVTHLPTLSYRPRFGAWERFERDHHLLATRRSGMTIDDAPELRYTVATWSWLFRREFLIENDLFFDEKQIRYMDHLFAVEMLQVAKRISTFEQYPHIWRRRGASMSTSPESLLHYSNLVNSIEMTCNILEEHYGRNSDAFQRDLGFFVIRLLNQWTLLEQCVPARHESPEKAEILERLSDELAKYEIDPAITADPILKKINPKRYPEDTRILIPLSELPRLYGYIVDKKWDELAAALELPEADASEPTATVKMGSGSPTPPSALSLWQDYSSMLNAENSLEHRLFSEYLLDECVYACERAISDGATQADTVDAEWPTTMHTDLAVLARRFDTSALFPPQDGWEHCRQLRDEAAAITDQFIQTLLEPEETAPKLRLNDVLDAWRSWEKAVLGETVQHMSTTLFKRGEEASLGDANWQAKRTLKSRIRAKVIEPLTGN